MKIDIYAHIMPSKYKDALFTQLGREIAMLENNPTITNLENRFRIMDKYEGLTQVLIPTGLPLEAVASPKQAAELAKLYNDEVAELVLKYPDRFLAAVAILPMNDMDAALKEADRAINELRFRGVLIYTPQYIFDPTRTKYPPWVDSKPIDNPEFIALYEKMAKYDLPIWIHPMRDYSTPDDTSEDHSRYHVWQVFSWPFETTQAVWRLILGGVLDHFPTLKVVTHHMGAMFPYFARRVEQTFDAFLRDKVPRHFSEYWKNIYGDTAVNGTVSAYPCGYAFFGPDRLMYGTDYPFGPEKGEDFIRENMAGVRAMDIPDEDKKKILGENARRLFRI